jgi:hypothetical protein
MRRLKKQNLEKIKIHIPNNIIGVTCLHVEAEKEEPENLEKAENLENLEKAEDVKNI